MIDLKSGYAIARKGPDGRYAILTDHREHSTRILLAAGKMGLSMIQQRKRELEAQGAQDLVLVQIRDERIEEMAG